MLNIYLRKQTNAGIKLGFTFQLFQSNEIKNDYQVHDSELNESIYLRESKKSLLANNFNFFIDRFKGYELDQSNIECLQACRTMLNYMIDNVDSKDLNYHLECVSNVKPHMLSLLKKSKKADAKKNVMMYYGLINFVEHESEKYKAEQSKI